MNLVEVRARLVRAADQIGAKEFELQWLMK